VTVLCAHLPAVYTMIPKPHWSLGGNPNIQYTETQPEESVPGAGVDDSTPAALPEMPLGIVIARIVIVSGMSFAAAISIFFLVGGIWEIAGAAAGVTVLFLFLMFAVEKAAEQ